LINLLKSYIRDLFSDRKFTEVITGSVWAISARVLATGLGLVVTVVIARFYGAQVMGVIAVLNSYLLLATVFTLLGTNTSILRLIPEHLVKFSATSAFRVYRKIQFMVIGISLIAGALFFFGSHLIADKVFSKPHLSPYFSIAAIFIVFKSLMLLNTQAVRGLKLIKMFAFMQVLPQGVNLLLLVFLGFFLAAGDIPVYAFLGSFVVTGIAGWAFMEYNFKRTMQPRDRVEPIAARTILSVSLPMLMTASMQFLIGQTGVILLGMFRTEAEVGYYDIAVKLANLTNFLLLAINSMAAPRFSELFQRNELEELFYVAKKSTRLIFWTTAPILFGLIVLGGPVLSFVFGKGFTMAYPSLVFLSIGQFVNSISGSTGTFMNMTGHEKNLQNILLGAATINILMSLLLIPSMGMIGAALAGMTSMTFWNAYTLFYIKSKYGRTIGYFPNIMGLLSR
jgi:O-antigen/teichoic acid export membrane protein